MGIRFKFLILALVCLTGSAALSANFDADALPEKLANETRVFFDADTGRARARIAAFSDEDLQRITTVFKKGHTAEEQRIFWLTEELYRRNAERVAAERIRYLYFAVLAALAIIAGFTAMTYAQTRRSARPMPALQAIAAPRVEVAPAPKKKVSKSTAKKGRRK